MKKGRGKSKIRREETKESEKGEGKKWREDFGCIGEILARKPNGLHKSCA